MEELVMACRLTNGQGPNARVRSVGMCHITAL